jgi:hypothetical protein
MELLKMTEQIKNLREEFKAVDFIVSDEQIKFFINGGYTIERFKEKFVKPHDSYWIRSAIYGEVSWNRAELEISKAEEFYITLGGL